MSSISEVQPKLAAAQTALAKAQSRVAKAHEDVEPLDELVSRRARIAVARREASARAYLDESEADLLAFDAELMEIDRTTANHPAQAARAALPTLMAAVNVAEKEVTDQRKKLEEATTEWAKDRQHDIIGRIKAHIEGLGPLLADLAAAEMKIVYRGAGFEISQFQPHYFGLSDGLGRLYQPTWAHRSTLNEIPGFGEAMRQINAELDAA